LSSGSVPSTVPAHTGCDLICFCRRALEAPGFKKQANAIYDLASPTTLDGLIVWTSVPGIITGPERLAEFCRRFQPLPMVGVEQPMGDAPLVVMDNRQDMYAAVSHLITVHGRRRIAFVRGPANHAGAAERYQRYGDPLVSHRLVEDPELVTAPPSAWLPEDAAGVSRMLAAGGHRGRQRGLCRGGAVRIGRDQRPGPRGRADPRGGTDDNG
jgi:hypothetical protein